jgi:hypothetical protein
MTRRWALVTCALAVTSLVACEDDNQRLSGPNGQAAFARYVAMGTSISMGVQSDGVLSESQVKAWPAQLARLARANFTQPLFRAPGCFAPLIAPLQLSRRLDGVSAAAVDTTCAGLLPGISPGQNDVAVDGAQTYYAHRLTPESTAVEAGEPKRRKQYPLILPAGQTQVTAMMAQDPTLVSVELGANEVLGTLGGLLFPAQAYRQPANTYTFIPAAVWQPEYDAIVDSVAKTGARALLVTVPDVSSLPSVRRGRELAADRATFQAFGVIVSPDCDANENAIFVAVKVPGLVGRAQATQTPQTLSCTDAPGQVDYVLTPTDLQTITAVVTEMNTHITQVATQRGWAIVDLNAVLAEGVAQNPAYSLRNQLGCVFPYGQYISLDGVHPNGFGHQLIANAAARALNTRYGFALPENPVTVLTAEQQCPPPAAPAAPGVTR